MSENSEFINGLNEMIKSHENQIDSGIFFKLEKNKEPSEIFGVLNFLKYKFQKWKVSSIFSYRGEFFDGDTVLIVGSKNENEAKNILFVVFLKELLKNPIEISPKEDQSIARLELSLEKEFSNNLKRGYPEDKDLERDILNHISDMINEVL
jgi:hypothetical protein